MREEEEEDQVRDKVEQEDGSTICSPLVLQQTCHYRVPQQVFTFVLHLQQHNRRETAMDLRISISNAMVQAAISKHCRFTYITSSICTRAT